MKHLITEFDTLRKKTINNIVDLVKKKTEILFKEQYIYTHGGKREPIFSLTYKSNSCILMYGASFMYEIDIKCLSHTELYQLIHILSK